MNHNPFHMRLIVLLLLLFSFSLSASCEDGYDLWLRYTLVKDPARLAKYQSSITAICTDEGSPTLSIIRDELQRAVPSLLGKKITVGNTLKTPGIAVVRANHPLVKAIAGISGQLQALGEEGYMITTVRGSKRIIVTANTDIGLLYGTFHFLNLLQNEKAIDNLDIRNVPAIDRRILNHWDNLDRTVERGYAGFSLWDWHKLPGVIDPRYHDYARANASIGINGTVVTNVNANALVLSEHYLEKVKALADVFRSYGIRVYLTARFSAPIELGGLRTADPLDPAVRTWWQEKVKEIYAVIPDFGGFLVKANSEGQPGPQNYNRTHADGANLLAEALAPFGGIVMWRAFVYDNEDKTDRVKQAYNEFTPLDGKFLPNVIIQVKNGPLDFQPREPFHPLFGAMPETPLMMEFQLTQEYLGFATHLVYLGTMFREVLDSDTHVKGPGSTVRKVIDGSLHAHRLNAIAGVANIGNDRNWCGHPFAQANWYVFGRLAWDPSVDVKEIAEEWIARTFSTHQKAIDVLSDIMMRSREVTVNYMTPLGLHHIMGWSHHYGPAPWIKDKLREDWTSVYYHRAGDGGIGFNRTPSGSNALEQYHPSVRALYNSPTSCPDEYLLWFHHLPWDHKMKSGHTLWQELCIRYYMGAQDVKVFSQQWQEVKQYIDEERFRHVASLLDIQEKEAIWWRNACVLYFQRFSKRDIPATLEKPERSLEYYESLEFPYAPGIRPQW
jgi:alpha-glucuronidase